MAEDQYTKILELQVNYEKAVKGIAEYNAKIREAKSSQDQLKQALKEGSITQEQYDQQMVAAKAVITQLKSEQAVLEKQLRQNIKAENANADSLVQLRARLSNLTAEYDALSGEMRNGDIGKALEEQINAVTDQLKGAEEDTQRFYRNVGNYANGVRDAFASMNKDLEETRKKYEEVAKAEGETSKAAQDLKAKMDAQKATIDSTGQYILNLQSKIIPFGDKLIPLLSKGLSGVKEAFVLAGQGAKILGQQLVALMANPIVAFLALVAAGIAALVSGIRSSEENMNRWQKVMAPLNRALSLLQSGVEEVCSWVLSLAEGIGFLAGKVLQFLNIATGGMFDGIIEGAQESIELQEREIKLTEDKRALQVREAKDELEIARLKKEANDQSNKDYEARAAAAKKAADLELALSEERKRIAKEEYEIAKARAEWSGNSAADNEKLAQLEAAMYKAETDYYNNTKKLQGQINSIEQSAANERKQRHEEYKRQMEEKARLAKEAADKEIAAIRAAEDALIDIITDASMKRREQIKTQYDREIEDLRNRLTTEKNLTDAAREAINQTIIAKETKRKQELDELEKSIAEDEANRRAEELRKIAEQEEAKRKAELQAMHNRYTELMMAAEDNSVQMAQLELELRAEELETLHQMEEESDEAFYARKLEAQQRYNDAHKKLTEEKNKVTQTELEAAATVTSGIKSVFESLGQSNKSFAKAAKVLALAEIAINTGKAMAAGIAQAQSVPYPANIAAIASTIAAVLSGVASAISTVNSAKFAKGGKVDADQINHASGGKIRGAGTGTSDSIPAMLSNGEFVTNAAATRMFEPVLEAMNNIGRGVSVPSRSQSVMMSENTNSLSNSIAESMREVHPVVSVVDINDGQERVRVIDDLDTI